MEQRILNVAIENRLVVLLLTRRLLRFSLLSDKLFALFQCSFTVGNSFTQSNFKRSVTFLLYNLLSYIQMIKWRKYWATFKWLSRIPSWTILAALRNPRANESIAPMCAMKRSFESVDSRRTLASKFNPPGCSPFYFLKHIKRLHLLLF